MEDSIDPQPLLIPEELEAGLAAGAPAGAPDAAASAAARPRLSVEDLQVPHRAAARRRVLARAGAPALGRLRGRPPRPLQSSLLGQPGGAARRERRGALSRPTHAAPRVPAPRRAAPRRPAPPRPAPPHPATPRAATV
jgi:hypothetical protein